LRRRRSLSREVQSPMPLSPVPIGIMFSSTGPYEVVARSMLAGARLAVAEVNAAADLPVTFDPNEINPAGVPGAYCAGADTLLRSGVRHVVGCYTSLSRKEVIPYFEKHDGLLWYPSHYEGFETSGNVVYTGAVTNQHLIPLIDHLLRHHGRRAFCIGSNYIWAWENNRVLRENLLRRDGSVVAERYCVVGETDFDQTIAAILDAMPSFVFTTLIGTSAYAFLRAFRRACRDRGIDQAATIPVASCSLSEPELETIGAEAVEGHLTSSVYFSSIASPENARFVSAYQAAYPDGPAVCADAEASYVAIWLLARALAEAGTQDVNAVRAAVGRQQIAAPQGRVWLDPETLHAFLTPRIGRSNASCRFDILSEAEAPVRPDPHLVWNSPRFDAPGAPQLRLVS
jgi:ABC-type branched-subunit amino acid transport system substrate-binding protein